MSFAQDALPDLNILGWYNPRAGLYVLPQEYHAHQCQRVGVSGHGLPNLDPSRGLSHPDYDQLGSPTRPYKPHTIVNWIHSCQALLPHGPQAQHRVERRGRRSLRLPSEPPLPSAEFFSLRLRSRSAHGSRLNPAQDAVEASIRFAVHRALQLGVSRGSITRGRSFSSDAAGVRRELRSAPAECNVPSRRTPLARSTRPCRAIRAASLAAGDQNGEGHGILYVMPAFRSKCLFSLACDRAYLQHHCTRVSDRQGAASIVSHRDRAIAQTGPAGFIISHAHIYPTEEDAFGDKWVSSKLATEILTRQLGLVFSQRVRAYMTLGLSHRLSYRHHSPLVITPSSYFP